MRYVMLIYGAIQGNIHQCSERYRYMIDGFALYADWLPDLWNLTKALNLVGRDLLQGITVLCHIDDEATTTACIHADLPCIGGLYRTPGAYRTYRTYCKYRSIFDILPFIFCVYPCSTYLLYIATLMCIL